MTVKVDKTLVSYKVDAYKNDAYKKKTCFNL